MMPKPLRFTRADAERAFDTWGCNCGPGAIAAVTGLTLEEVRQHLGDFERKRYTNPTLMWSALASIGRPWHRKSWPGQWPQHGLCRVQWHGPWMAPDVPVRARYRQTHWIGAALGGPRGVGIFDINCMASGGWVALQDWQAVIVPHILKTCVPRADGRWSLTHVVEVQP